MAAQKNNSKLTTHGMGCLDQLTQTRNVSDSEPLQILVKKSSKYIGPPQITNCYFMCSSPRGQALIINNESFDEIRVGDGKRHRKGSKVDGNNLQQLFHELGFNVDLQRNLTRNQMENSINNFANSENHIKSNMAILAILSHGSDGILYGVDNGPLYIEDITEQLNNENCIHLRGKPKFFIFQGCRGLRRDYGTPTQEFIPSLDNDPYLINKRTENDAKGFNMPRRAELRSPTVEDMLIAWSTIPGYVANRNTIKGSWFVECICRVFMRCAATMDIRDMLDKVSMEMRNYEDENGMKQTCSYEVRHFYRKVYLNPGIDMQQIRSNEGTSRNKSCHI